MNQLTLQLIGKQNEVDTLKKSQKEMEGQMKEFKKLKAQWEKEKILKQKELEDKDKMLNDMKDNAKVSPCNNKEITELRKINMDKIRNIQQLTEDLDLARQHIDEGVQREQSLKNEIVMAEDRCKSLTGCNSELENRVQVLESIAGDLNKDQVKSKEVISVPAKTDSINSVTAKELDEAKLKIEKLNKNNSIMKSELKEKEDKLKGIDDFYKEIIDDKEKISNGYLQIVEKDDEKLTKFKRLLLKFRSENELKFVLELKDLLGRDDGNLNQTKDVTTNHNKNNISGVESKKDESNMLDDGKSTEGKENSVVQKKKNLCKDGKECLIKDSCPFRHTVVNKQCKFGGTCSRGGKCLFIHDDDDFQFHAGGFGFGSNSGNGFGLGNSGFGADFESRSRYNQMYENPQQNQLGYHNQRRRDGDWGGDVGGNGVPHNDARLNGKVRLCRFGSKCQDGGCSFSHEIVNKLCRNKEKCRKGEQCLFKHLMEAGDKMSSESREANRWLRPAKN